MDRLIHILLIIFGFSQVSLLGQPISFIKERIEIIVDEGYCKLVGTYYYENKGLEETEMNLFYPFVIDENLPFPDSIIVKNTLSSEIVRHYKTNYGVYFKIKVPPLSTEVYEVCYYQKTLANRMEYIITTTKKWGEPLREADFLFRLPLKYNIESLSYEYDKKESDDIYTTYYVNKINFMPEHDLVLSWK